MAHVYENPNPKLNVVSDCVIRALSIFFNKSWDEIFMDLSVVAFELKNIMEANYVWGEYLKRKNLDKYFIENTCPDCYTIRDFCKDHPRGSFILATGSHVVAVINGDYHDTWDSGDEVPIYYWMRKET